MSFLKKSIHSTLRNLGYQLQPVSAGHRYPVEFTDVEKKAFDHVRARNLSMVSDERLFATILACKHVLDQGIPGDFVECGVFRGGNAILAKMIFDAYRSERKVWLFDTFLGMTKPTPVDIGTSTGEDTLVEYLKMDRGDHNEWVFCPIDQVKANFDAAGLLDDRVTFVQGDVLKTLDQPLLPEGIAVLRLDTDWYESTKKELQVLYPRLSVGGVLLIDDYGHFQGAQRATDEYFIETGARPLLNYTDYTGRVAVKVSAAAAWPSGSGDFGTVRLPPRSE